MSAVVTRLSVTPVKGTRLHSVEEVQLERAGARGDRRFFVIDAHARMVNAKQIGELLTVVASSENGRLSLTFPDGKVVSAPLNHGGSISARFYSRTLPGRLVLGPFAEALSAHADQPLQLLEPAAGAVDRGGRGAITLISRGSLDRLAAEARRETVDARRFRMLVEVDGLEPHAEDEWLGRTMKVGSARVRWGGHVGRCLVTSRDPDSGQVDLPTLDLLRDYRGTLRRTEPLAFGIYGSVLEEGLVRVGDSVVPD